jgi:WD40 repeat protein
MKQTRNIARHSFASILSVIVATLILKTIALGQVIPRWIPTGNLNIARSGHTATLLPNGKVLVVGGDSSGSGELYDPATGTWSLTGSLNTPTGGHTATLLPNGKVLVVGDYNDRAELYDPATETWSLTGSLNMKPRQGHTATLLPNGQVLVVAGATDLDIGGGDLLQCRAIRSGQWDLERHRQPPNRAHWPHCNPAAGRNGLSRWRLGSGGPRSQFCLLRLPQQRRTLRASLRDIVCHSQPQHSALEPHRNAFA